MEKLYTKKEVYEILADNYMKYDTLDEYWDVIGEIFWANNDDEDEKKI